jgi:signal transduction histidine kinase
MRSDPASAPSYIGPASTLEPVTPGPTDARRSGRVFVSLAIRITVFVVLLVVAVAALVYWGLVRQSRSTLLGSKRAAAEMVVRLTSVSVMPAVVFGDPEEMQRAVRDLSRNRDVTDVELWSTLESDSGAASAPLASFHRAGGQKLGRPGDSRSKSFFEGDSVRVVEPVVNLESKTIGVMTVRFTTLPEVAALARLSQQILYASSAAALLLAAAILWVVVSVVVRPVKRLQEAAQRLARGEAAPVERARRVLRVEDEVVRLGERFTEMANAVRDREARLGVRNKELKLILDSVRQGFLTALPDGTILPERSAIIERWTGVLPSELSVSDLIERIDPRARPWADVGWSQIADGFIPLEVALAQLPKRLERDGQHFDLAYYPVLAGNDLDRLVLVLTDVTAEVERQRALAEQQEFSVLVDQFVRDRRAFKDFWSEASTLVAQIMDQDSAVEHAVKRSVHTLKGSARFFGLNRIAALCHRIEDAMRDRGEQLLSDSERAELAVLWSSLRQRIEPLLQGSTAFVDVSQEEYEKLMVAVQIRAPFEHIEELLKGLRREPVATRLDRAKAALIATAEKLGKTAPRIVIRHDDLRLPPAPWAPFWSVLLHVLNNAVDHGLEPDEERRTAGKSVPGTIWLSASATHEEFTVEVRDDGRGIDWDAVKERARATGLPSTSRADLAQALLADGFTLKSEVTEVSGRGVGLAAVKSVVTAMGGKIEVESQHARGTLWRFRFPARRALDWVSEESNPPAVPPSSNGVVLAG